MCTPWPAVVCFPLWSICRQCRAQSLAHLQGYNRVFVCILCAKPTAAAAFFFPCSDFIFHIILLKSMYFYKPLLAKDEDYVNNNWMKPKFSARINTKGQVRSSMAPAHSMVAPPPHSVWRCCYTAHQLSSPLPPAPSEPLHAKVLALTVCLNFCVSSGTCSMDLHDLFSRRALEGAESGSPGRPSRETVVGSTLSLLAPSQWLPASG